MTRIPSDRDQLLAVRDGGGEQADQTLFGVRCARQRNTFYRDAQDARRGLRAEGPCRDV
jgi:hypothetical protein